MRTGCNANGTQARQMRSDSYLSVLIIHGLTLVGVGQNLVIRTRRAVKSTEEPRARSESRLVVSTISRITFHGPLANVKNHEYGRMNFALGHRVRSDSYPLTPERLNQER